MGIVNLYEVDGNLTFIQSLRSFRPNKIRLGEIVDHFGDPEYFNANLYIGTDYYVYTLEVYYPQKGLAFEILPDQKKDIDWMGSDIFEKLPDQEKVVGSIGANMAVRAIHYFEPGDLSSYDQNRYPCSLNTGQSESEKFIQDFRLYRHKSLNAW